MVFCNPIYTDPQFIPPPKWLTTHTVYKADRTVNNVSISWPKRHTLVHEVGLMCSKTNDVCWSTNTHDSSTTIHLPANTSSCLQFRTYVKNVGDRCMASKPTVDTTTLYCCIASETRGVIVVTGASLQSVWVYYLGNKLAQQCLAPRENVEKVHCSYSCGNTQINSLVSVIFKEGTSAGKKEIIILIINRNLYS